MPTTTTTTTTTTTPATTTTPTTGARLQLAYILAACFSPSERSGLANTLGLVEDIAREKEMPDAVAEVSRWTQCLTLADHLYAIATD